MTSLLVIKGFLRVVCSVFETIPSFWWDNVICGNEVANIRAYFKKCDYTTESNCDRKPQTKSTFSFVLSLTFVLFVSNSDISEC